MTTIKTTVRNRRIDVAAPSNIPDGADVILIVSESESDVMTSQETERILSAMRSLELTEIPANVMTDLDEWERRINQRGIDYHDPSLENVFP